MQHTEQNHSPTSVFVTGSTGLVGSHLVAALVGKGYNVSALYRKEIPVVPHQEKVRWIQGDILDVISLEEAMQGVDHVYHCAAVVSFSPKDVDQLFKINIEGTANVVNAAVANNVKKLGYVSSVAALGRTPNVEEINETMNWSEETSNSNYGKSKFHAEMEVWRGIGEGLPAVIINPSIILGAGDWNSGSTKLFKTAYDEFGWYSEGTTGFVDVADVVDAFIQLVESDVSAQRFIISAENITYQELFTIMAKCFGKKPPHKKVTPLLASLVWRLDALKAMFTGNKPLITKETAVAAQATVKYNNSKINQYLHNFNYKPLEESIEAICKSLIKKYNL
ncbi:NAD-dependent epimerase/dehydratase family protein [Aridibaculum aurantiacum]|uniref:NAD-dependent epimerase/dehydratase family protein n=1 Tax=Aridibaculum aurantiacum TaxID=2810307 RepID=UPI001A9646D0|nr:NAD-dependent epimerase/dehydratase family protein [Aridibaculum aurantiacum]